MNSQLENYSTSELFELYANIMDQLIEREVTRSFNNPVGDYTEWLVAQAFGLALQRNSQAAYDAIDDDGTRYQIKGRRLTTAKSSRQLSYIRNLENNDFDFLLGVIFSHDFAILEAYKIPHHVIGSHAYYSRYVNAHILHLKGPILTATGVEKVDSRLRPHALAR